MTKISGSEKVKVRELPDIERPIFKLRYFGADRLSNTELVQIITGVGDTETASNILAASDGPLYLHKMTIEELEGISGVGEATAGRIVVAMELARRAGWTKLRPASILASRSQGRVTGF